MALQIYTNPNLAPELLYAGANALGHGLGQGLQQAGDNISKALDQRKKESQEADALRKLAEVRGWADKDTLNMLGIGQLRGLSQAKHDEEQYQLRDVQTRLAQSQLQGEGELGAFAQAAAGGDIGAGLQAAPHAAQAPGFGQLAYHLSNLDTANRKKAPQFWSEIADALGPDDRLTPGALSKAIKKTGFIPDIETSKMVNTIFATQVSGDKTAMNQNRLAIYAKKVEAQVQQMANQLPPEQRLALKTELDHLMFSTEAEKMTEPEFSDAVTKIVGRHVTKARTQGPAGPMRVIGPNGQTGTVPAGTALPPGWRLAQ
jgi:hypothetical protein